MYNSWPESYTAPSFVSQNRTLPTPPRAGAADGSPKGLAPLDHSQGLQLVYAAVVGEKAVYLLFHVAHLGVHKARQALLLKRVNLGKQLT